MGFAWNLILFSFMREREGYKHHADCTVLSVDKYSSENSILVMRSISIDQKQIFKGLICLKLCLLL